MRPFLIVLALLALAPNPSLADSTPAAIKASAVRVDSLIAAETRVRWATDAPDSAIARARREGRPAFLDFYATWCAPCRWMDRIVYSDPLLSEVAEGVAMIRIDVDKPDGKAIATRMGIQQYPTLVHLSPEGKETLRWVGPLNLRDTRLNLAQAATPSSGRARAEAAAKKQPDDAAAQVQAIGFYAYRGEVENARARAKAYLAAAPNDSPASRAGVLALAKAEEMAGRDERAIEAYRRVVEIDPEGFSAARAWLGLSSTLERKGESVQALAAARAASARGPQSSWLESRVARLALGMPRPPPPPGVEDGPQ